MLLLPSQPHRGMAGLPPVVFLSHPLLPMSQVLLGAGKSLIRLAQGLAYGRCSINE